MSVCRHWQHGSSVRIISILFHHHLITEEWWKLSQEQLSSSSSLLLLQFWRFLLSNLNPRRLRGWESQRRFWVSICFPSFLVKGSSQHLLDELFVFQNVCLHGIILILLVLDLLLQLHQFSFQRFQNSFSFPASKKGITCYHKHTQHVVPSLFSVHRK